MVSRDIQMRAGPAPAALPKSAGSVPGNTSCERELWLVAEADELERARRFAESAATDYGLAEDHRFQFTFAVNEAVANAIEHGGPSPQGTIKLCVAEEHGSLCFYVWDWGRFAPGLRGVEAVPERGRGLALMAALVDEVDLRPAGKTTLVRLAKSLAA